MKAARAYSTLARIAFISAAEKARKDCVRTFPSAQRLKLSAVPEMSSGASVIILSLRPKNFPHGHAEFLRHVLKGLGPLYGVLRVADALVSKVR